MNTEELVRRLAARAKISHESARSAVDAVIEEMALGLVRGDRVLLYDFGTFNITVRSAYTGRNPRTGQPVAVPSRMSPVFRAGRGLKKAILERGTFLSTPSASSDSEVPVEEEEESE